MIEVKINIEACIGCGGCILICPEVFEYSGDIKAQIKRQFRERNENPHAGIIIDEKTVEKIMQVEKLCPTHAITIKMLTQSNIF